MLGARPELTSSAPALLVFVRAREARADAARLLGTGDAQAIREYILSYGIWAPVMSALLMVLQAVLAPVPAFLLAFANGLAFGAFRGGVLTLASATLAAILCFGIARGLGRDAVIGLVGRRVIAKTDRWFERWGWWSIPLARLLPLISFDVVSYAAGLTSIRFRSFLAATVIGAAPASFAYSYLGERAPGLLKSLFAVSALVVLASVVSLILRRARSRAGA